MSTETGQAQNRAHNQEGDLGQVPMLDIRQLSELFDYCENMVRSLRLFHDGSFLADEMDMNIANAEETAKDLVDLALFGHVRDIARTFGCRPRDEVYAELHRIHDELQGTEDAAEFFNDVQYTEEFQAARK